MGLEPRTGTTLARLVAALALAIGASAATSTYVIQPGSTLPVLREQEGA